MQGYVKTIELLFGWLADEEIITKSRAARLQKPSGEKRLWVSVSDEHLSLLFGVCDRSRRWAFATTPSCWCSWTLAFASRSFVSIPPRPYGRSLAMLAAGHQNGPTIFAVSPCGRRSRSTGTRSPAISMSTLAGGVC